MAGTRRTALLGAAVLVGGLLVAAPTAEAVHLPVGFRQEIASPGSDDVDSFGNAVAIDGETLVVGMPSTGRVHAYTRNPSTGRWEWLQEITGFAIGDDFGTSVALQGNTLVIGAPGAGPSDEGEAYVWLRDPATGLFEYDRTLGSDATTGDSFGWRVAIDGDVLVVGAPFTDDGPAPAPQSIGAAHVYDRQPDGGWSYHGRLAVPGPEEAESFGRAVGVRGEWILVGAPSAGGGGRPGRVLAYEIKPAPGFSLADPQEILSPAPEIGSCFGWAVAIDGDLLAVGQPWANRGGSLQGAAHLFRLDGGKWQALPDQIADPGPRDGAAFGRALAIRDGVLAVGAPWDDEGGDERGTVHLFAEDPETGKWSYEAQLTAEAAADGDWFGYAIAVDGDWIAVGKPEDSSGGARGSVQAFAEDSPPGVSIGVPGPDEFYAEGSTVLAAFLCSDGESGIASCLGDVGNGEPIDTSTPGEHTFTVIATNGVGNTLVKERIYRVDDTDPVVTIASPGFDAVFARGSTVLASYSCEDPESGIALCEGDVGIGEPIDTARLGTRVFVVQATNGAGMQTSTGRFYTVVPACNGLPVTHVVPPGGERFGGTSGDDVILGTDGPDEIAGFGGNDTICGGGGDDLLLGGKGDDTLLGGDGNDKLRGAAGNDRLYGGAGSDRLLPETGRDLVDGGAGSDILDFLAADGPVAVNLAEGWAVLGPPARLAPGQSRAELVRVEKVDGTRFGDTLTGDGRRNVLRGKQGDDTIAGAAGDDDLIGGTGADRVWGGDGDDLVKGQADDDLLLGEAGSDRLVGGHGSDALYGGGGDDTLIGGLRVHLGVFVNVLDGGAGLDVCRWEPVTTNCP